MGRDVCLYSALLGLRKLVGAKADFGNEWICPVCHEARSSVEFLPQG